MTGANAVTIYDPAEQAYAQQLGGEDGSMLLDTIEVDGAHAVGSGYLGTPDRVYETPGSVSVISREAIQGSGLRNTRDLTSLAAGVYSGEGQGSYPTVSPNIRGVQDSGRVVVSIDGARQNAQDGGRYGGSGLANFGGAFVDSAFIREIDIDKNPGAAAGNAGALGGTVNFRTVRAEDLIKPGKRWGVEVDATRGTNQHTFQGSVLGAARIGEHLSLTMGLSRLSLGKYEPGSNGVGGGTFGLTNRDAWSSLLKIEGSFGDFKASLSWMHQQNDFAYTPVGGTDDLLRNIFDARNDSVVADFAWNPENPLINIKARAWLNDAVTDETREARVVEGILLTPETHIDKRLRSFGGTLENTSILQTGMGPLTLNYGVEAFRDDATRSVTSATIAENPLWASGYGSFSPPGQRDVASLFVNGKWQPADWVTLTAGLRYDWTRLHGSARYYSRQNAVPDRYANAVVSRGEYLQLYYPADFANQTNLCNSGVTVFCTLLAQMGEIYTHPTTGVPTFAQAGTQTIPGTGTPVQYPEHVVEIDRSYGALLPSATIEFKPVDWFRPYVSYAQTFRPPTITEAFIGGALSPGDYVGTNLAPNANLRPETARTWEAGFNVIRNGLFTGDDRLRLKAAVFHREIDDYIMLGYLQTAEVAGWEYNGFVNAAGTTTMRGIELEGNYDAGRFWIGGAATWLETRWPDKTEVFNNGSSAMTRCIQYDCGTTTSGDIFAVAGNVPPRQKFTVDAGLRFLDRKVSVGARLHHVTPTLARTLDDEGNLVEITEPYTTVDVYASVRLDDRATMRFAVNNVTDRNYVPAGANYSAPGRTFLMGVNLKLP